jgi:REP element-mobilizing transposase RayT
VSYPRAVVPGRTYLITRRCSERRFLLRPDDRTTQAFWYCLAEAAELCQVEICAALAVSNHYHALLHDPKGRYPEFLERFHAMLAKVQNVHWGRWESLWAAEQTSAVLLVEPSDAFDKMIYTLSNPVKDHLVEHASEWPGATSLFAQLSDHPITTRRPHWFFAPDTQMPLEATIRFKRLPGFEHLTKKEWAEKITAAIAVVEAAARAERLEQRRHNRGSGRVVGCKTLRTQSAFDSPQSHEPRRELSPRVAAKNKWRRIEALLRNKVFLADYRAALLARRAGDAAVRFPHGSYQLSRHGLVLCAPAPARARNAPARAAAPANA